MSAPSLPTVVIEPKRSLFQLDLRDVWAYWELLYFLAWRDMKARYAQTAIGVGWAILQPLATMMVFTLVFSMWAKMPSEGLPYPLFVYTALLPWTFLSKSLERSSVSIVSEASLIQKVYFPRLIIPVAAIIGGLIDFVIAFGILLGMMVWYGVMPTARLVALPLFVFMILATSLAVSLWLSAVHVKYRDVAATIPLLTQLWMYASPVVYPVSLVPEQWRTLYALNPMAGVIEGFRWALLGKSSPDVQVLIIGGIVVITILVTGLVYFKSVERNFADLI
jgi:lipopolysaccharide transport system permease protein